MSTTAKIKENCRICNSHNLVSYIDLGQQPLSNSFIRIDQIDDEPRFPLVVNLCQNCGLSQLSEVVPAEQIFSDYVYLSSSSSALVSHYQGMVDEIIQFQGVKKDCLIVDIGCNDGITLSRYPVGKYNLLGVEPSSAGDFAVKSGFKVERIFFDYEAAQKLKSKYGSAEVVTATNVFAHVDDIRSFTRGVSELLSTNGVFVLEFPYLIDMIDRLYFDTIYHEHLSYLTLTPLIELFGDFGMRPIKVQRIDIGASGPALRLFVSRDNSTHVCDVSVKKMLQQEKEWGVKDPKSYLLFSNHVAHLKKNLLKIIQDINESGGRVGAYGAPAKGNTLLNYLGVTKTELSAVADNNPLKIDKLTPGTHLPIVSDEEFLSLGNSHALLLSWNYADFFLKNSSFIKSGGVFIVPFPQPKFRP